MIPIAGHVAGANGTEFQTDLTISNTNVDALVEVYWLPQNRSGSMTTPVAILPVPAASVVTYEDFVVRTIHQTGLGTIILRGLDNARQRSEFVRIDAYARIWTPAQCGSGTMSQGVQASTLYGPKVDDFSPITGLVYGLRQDADFRTNIGIINMSSERTVTFRVDIRGTKQQQQMQLVVPPASMVHEALPPGDFGAVTLGIHVLGQNPPPPDAFSGPPWTAFGSSVDNHSGDAWYSKAQAAYVH